MKTWEIVHSVMSAILVTLLCVILGNITKFVVEFYVPIANALALYSMALIMFCFVVLMMREANEDPYKM